MNAKIVSFSKEDLAMKAVGFMSSTNILSVPIINNGVLVGVLSYKDAMTALLKAKKEQFKQNQCDPNARPQRCC
jgi:predicted transcriptional regulator